MQTSVHNCGKNLFTSIRTIKQNFFSSCYTCDYMRKNFTAYREGKNDPKGYTVAKCLYLCMCKCVSTHSIRIFTELRYGQARSIKHGYSTQDTTGRGLYRTHATKAVNSAES